MGGDFGDKFISTTGEIRYSVRTQGGRKQRHSGICQGTAGVRSGRGASAGAEGRTVRDYSNVSLMLIDEASRVRDEIYQAMRPSLAAGDGDLWLMSTPNGKRGFFWEAWAHGGEAWERVQVAAPDCPRISARMLEEEQAAQGESMFRQ